VRVSLRKGHCRLLNVSKVGLFSAYCKPRCAVRPLSASRLSPGSGASDPRLSPALPPAAVPVRGNVPAVTGKYGERDRGPGSPQAAGGALKARRGAHSQLVPPPQNLPLRFALGWVPSACAARPKNFNALGSPSTVDGTFLWLDVQSTAGDVIIASGAESRRCGPPSADLLSGATATAAPASGNRGRHHRTCARDRLPRGSLRRTG
jgi:hypothetical protein